LTGLPQTLQVIVPFFDRTSSLSQLRQFVKVLCEVFLRRYTKAFSRFGMRSPKWPNPVLHAAQSSPRTRPVSWQWSTNSFSPWRTSSSVCRPGLSHKAQQPPCSSNIRSYSSIEKPYVRTNWKFLTLRLRDRQQLSLQYRPLGLLAVKDSPQASHTRGYLVVHLPITNSVTLSRHFVKYRTQQKRYPNAIPCS
jgi:hypothetical protein